VIVASARPTAGALQPHTVRAAGVSSAAFSWPCHSAVARGARWGACGRNSLVEASTTSRPPNIRAATGEITIGVSEPFPSAMSSAFKAQGQAGPDRFDCLSVARATIPLTRLQHIESVLEVDTAVCYASFVSSRVCSMIKRCCRTPHVQVQLHLCSRTQSCKSRSRNDASSPHNISRPRRVI